MNLLVVDDDQNYRELASEVLSLQGHVVHTAADGAEAYQMLQTDRIEIVVSDIRMPRLNGMELHRLIRFSESYRKTPFVYISGYLDYRLGKVIENPSIDFFMNKNEPLSFLVGLVGDIENERNREVDPEEIVILPK
jgi:DNA-binding NtrC family response regulator